MNKYLIEGEEVTEKVFNDSLEVNLNDQYTEDDFEDLISESYPEVIICGITFGAGRILRKCDRTAFEYNYKDKINSLLADAQNDLENYNLITVNGYTYEIKETKEDK